MKITLLDKAKKKKFIERTSNLGIKKIPQLLIKTGKERIRAYSGNLSKEEIIDLWRILPIEGIGLYVAKDSIQKNGVRETRLSLDGLHLYKDQIKNNLLDLTQSQEEDWFKGKNLDINNQDLKGEFVAIKSKEPDDFIGTGKISNDGKTLHNFLPKERRRKSQTI